MPTAAAALPRTLSCSIHVDREVLLLPRRTVQLRLLVVSATLAPLLVTAAALVSLSVRSHIRTVEDLTDHALRSATQRVDVRVGRLITQAQRIGDRYHAWAVSGKLSLSNLQQWEPWLLTEMGLTSNVSSICFGSSDGRVTWLLRRPARTDERSAPRDPAPRDPSPRDPFPRDPSSRDATSRDSASRDPGPRDSPQRDRDPAPRDPPPRDQAPRDTKPPGFRLEVGRTLLTAGERLVAEHVVDPRTGLVDPTPIRQYPYDPRRRPWYATATQSVGGVWTAAYPWFAEEFGAAVMSTGYARAVHTDPKEGQPGGLEGVVVVDISLAEISSFLRTIDLTYGRVQPAADPVDPDGVAPVGEIFIIDDTGALIASSTGSVTDPDGARVLASLSGRAAMRKLAALNDFMVPMETGVERRFRFHVGDAAVRAGVFAVSPGPGIRWTIATVLPESSYLSGVNSALYGNLALVAITLAGAITVAVVLANRLTRPLLQLADRIRRIDEGDLETRLSIRSTRELAELSDRINTMVDGLRERRRLQEAVSVAVAVQRSLLPLTDPQVPGLEMAGRSRYCDDAGGDYFDFIRFQRDGHDTMLIAVGDVMGHGLGSALVMAAARAALRTHIAEPRSLGELMTRVNAALSTDNRDHRFMTMSLAAIDPGEGTLRWSCAGHEPILLYNASTDTFGELADGDLPLGLDAALQFEEFGPIRLGKGWLLFIGTDGVWRTLDAAGDQFGKPRIKEIIRAHHQAGAAAVARELENALTAFRGSAALSDDATFVIARIVSADVISDQPPIALPTASAIG